MIDRNPPSTAFILAAGFGTRLYPLTETCPKALVPLWGRSMLGHHISMLKTWGVKRIIINTHHHAERISAFCKPYVSDGTDIIISHEKEILGTGGALRNASKFLAPDEPFWLINADVAVDLDPSLFIRHWNNYSPLAVLWVTAAHGPRTVEVDENSVICFRSQHPGTPGTVTFCGLHLLHPRIIQHLPEKGFCSIITAYETALRDGKSVHALECPDSFWADIGTPEQYINAHRDIEEAYKRNLAGAALYNPKALEQYAALEQDQVIVDGFVSLGTESAIGGNTRIRDSILWDHVTVDEQLDIHRVTAAGPVDIVTDFAAERTVIVPAEKVLDAIEESVITPFFGNLKYGAEILPVRGSDRSYIRLANRRFTCMLCRYDAGTRKENAHHASHTIWLRQNGIPVPGLLHHDSEKHFAVYEDAGKRDLLTVMQQHGVQAAKPFYEQVINSISRLHTHCTRIAINADIHLEPSFSRDLYQWEHSLFIDELVRPRLPLTTADEAALRSELMTIATVLLQQPLVLIHRDLQSSNVLIRDEKICLIDYQGMRPGAAAYDLASLLYDPYTQIPNDLQADLLKLYSQLTGNIIEPEILAAAVIQRLIQALGAYGRLGKNKATVHFLKHIPPALKRVKQSLSFFPKLTKLEQLTQSLDRC